MAMEAYLVVGYTEESYKWEGIYDSCTIDVDLLDYRVPARIRLGRSGVACRIGSRTLWAQNMRYSDRERPGQDAAKRRCAPKE